MLLIIHNLPPNMSMANIKKLIKDNCSAEDVILDNFINEGQSKRVTVGLADETDAALLIRNINGLFLGDYQLFVENIRQKRLADRPQNSSVPKLSDPVNQQLQYENASSMQISPLMAAPTYTNVPFYMSPVQNPYVNHDKATVVNPLPQVPFYQQDLSFGYQPQPENQNRWIEQPVVSYPDKKVSLLNSDAKAKDRNSQRGRRQDFSRERTSNFRERRESPPRRGEFRRRRDDNDKRFNEPGPRRYARRSLSREQERYSRNPGSRYDEFYKSNRVERSPPYDRRLNSQDDDRGSGRGNDRHGRAIKLDRDFNFRQGVVDSREQDYDFGKRDYDVGNRDYNTDNRNADRDEYNYHVNEGHSGFDMPGNNEVYNHPNSQKFGEHGNSMYEQSYQEPDFEINRSYSDLTETFSNNPNGSTFTNFNSDTYIQSSTDFNAPPAKVPRFSNLNVDKSGCIHPASTVTKNDTFANKSDPNKSFVIPMISRDMKHTLYFPRAAAIIAKEVAKTSKAGYLPNYEEVCQNLKKCIESRIDVIMQGKRSKTIKEVIKCYRFKFGVGDDPKFFKAVLEKTNRGMEESEYPYPGDGSMSDNFENYDLIYGTPNRQPQANNMAGQGPHKYQPKIKPKPFGNPSPNPPANASVQQKQSNRLPRFPQGNKQLFKEQKKQSKMEYMVEDMYNLDPVLLNALNEELYKLCEAYLMGSSQPADDEDEEKTRLMLRRLTPYSFRKVMRVHLTKRLLNVTDNLIIRIFVHPKYPNRDELDQFLKDVGITSVRKSDTKRLYLAMAPSYEVYDDLLAMQHTKLGNISLQFRPLHITGPPAKKFNKKNKQPEEDDEDIESGNDEVIERLIKETENMVSKAENVHVTAISKVEQSAGTVAEVCDDNADKVVVIDDYTNDVDVDLSKKHDVIMIDDDKSDGDSEVKKEIKGDGDHVTNTETKIATENNDKTDNVEDDNSEVKTELDVKSDDAKENTETINEEVNAVNDKADEEAVADSAEVNEENLCAVDVDDDDLEDF